MASLIRRAALVVIAAAAAAAITAPAASRAASLTDGLSVRVGFFHPTGSVASSITDFAAWGAGVEYRVPWVPHVFNGEHWSSSISADFYYSGRKDRILRFIPVMVNQVYTFEERNGTTPYAGFCLGVGIVGTTGPLAGSQPTVGRLGGGLILGVDFASHLYLEGRYEWYDKYKIAPLEGFRAMLGYRF